jgi:hypothetical protein
VILIVCAIVFLVVLFFIKNGLPFRNNQVGLEVNKENVLRYGDYTVAELVYKDTDQDGVPDWEEVLWGLDPANRETTPGVPDITTVTKLKAEQSQDYAGLEGEGSLNDENLTETDKFSRELFSTVAALNQSGVLDQSAVDKISDSLASHIQNSPQKKIFTASDINIVKDDSIVAIKKYADALAAMSQKYSINSTVGDVLQKFIADENNVDSSVLSELGPIITQSKGLINAMVSVGVPQSLAPLHLEVINGLERLVENTSDISLYEKDAVVALGGISQYEKNTALLESAVKNLGDAIANKLNN